MEPKDKVAIVTGAASGIGLAVTKILLSQGVKGVAVCDINITKGQAVIEELQKEFGKDRTVFIKIDVSKEEEVEDAFKQTFEKFGAIDIVINNAGILGDQKWNQEIDINMKGCVHGNLMALKYMSKENGGNGGVVINMSSIAGVGEETLLFIYSATKHAVVGLTRCLGAEYPTEKTGIRVMAICPGGTTTDLNLPGRIVTYHDEWMEKQNQDIQKYRPAQKPECVGEAMLHMICKGKSGSIWISEWGEHYEIKIPSYKQLRV